MDCIASLSVDNDEIIKGNICVTNLQELYSNLATQKFDRIYLRKDFTDEYFTPSALHEFINNAVSISDGVDVIPEDLVYGFQDDAIEHIRGMHTEEEFVSAFLLHPEIMIDTVHSLCDSYYNAYNETLLANNKLSTLHMQYINLLQKYEELRGKYDNLLELKRDYADSLETLVSRINYKYNKDVDINKLRQVEVDICRYTKILYVKEITRVKFVDTFIYYLTELLKTLYGVPTRYVVIEPSYAHYRNIFYPSCKPSDNLTYNDVKESDIFMAGFQSRLMESILSNPSHVNYLVILDRTQLKNVCVIGNKVEYVYTVSDTEDIEEDTPRERLLTYSPDTLHIPFIENFDKLAVEEKIKRYSSMESMQDIIKLMEA